MRDDEINFASNERLADVPRGALALASIAVGLLLLAWFFIYFLVFLPRGSVG
jgi:hypothetical protein